MIWVVSLLQNWICEELNAMMSKVWWGNQGSEKKKIIGWVGQSFANWNKSRGDLGFRDHQFNLALLVMMETSDSSGLLAISDIEIKILPFHPSRTYLEELTSNVSYTITSIMQAREVMKMENWEWTSSSYLEWPICFLHLQLSRWYLLQISCPQV